MDQKAGQGQWLAATLLGLLAALTWVSPALADGGHTEVGSTLVLTPVVLIAVGLGGLLTGYFMYRIFR